MENLNSKPRDLMNIEFSSQLPFTLPKVNSIRLFGKEFGGSDPSITTAATAATTTTVFCHQTTQNRETPRTFECHYCSRNFSTSQALGGHQNAHRRERLHAKRTHIQSVMIHHAYPNHHTHPLTITTSPPYHHDIGTRSLIYYNTSDKFKVIYTSSQTPIFRRPLTVLRFPTSMQKLTAFKCAGLSNYSNTGSSSRRLYMHEFKPTVNDQVSLDLHL